MPLLSPYEVIPSGSTVTANSSVAKSQLLQTTGDRISDKLPQRDEPSTPEDETHHTDDDAADNGKDVVMTHNCLTNMK